MYISIYNYIVRIITIYFTVYIYILKFVTMFLYLLYFDKCTLQFICIHYVYFNLHLHIQNYILTIYIYILRLLHVYFDLHLYVYDISLYIYIYIMIHHILQFIVFTDCLITCNL